MFGLLQHLNKTYGFWVIILTLPLATAYQLGASPSELILETLVNNEMCKYITITADPSTLTLETRWSPIKSKNLKDYTSTAHDMDITVDIPQELTDTQERTRVCITPHNDYASYGVLLIHSTERSVSIGIWIHLNQKGKKRFVPLEAPLSQEEKSKITSKQPPQAKSSNKSLKLYLVLAGCTLVLLLIAALLSLYSKKRSRLSS